jgi:hypothetical protein
MKNLVFVDRHSKFVISTHNQLIFFQMNTTSKIIAWLKRLGWAGFFFFLAKGLILYVLLPYLIAKGFWK